MPVTSPLLLRDGHKDESAYSRAYDSYFGPPIVDQTNALVATIETQTPTPRTKTKAKKKMRKTERKGKRTRAKTKTEPFPASMEFKNWDKVRKGIAKARKFDAAYDTFSRGP